MQTVVVQASRLPRKLQAGRLHHKDELKDSSCIGKGQQKMMRTTKNVWLSFAGLCLIGSIASAQQMALPVKLSDNGRYFVDQNGKPVFWLATTQWELIYRYALDDVKTILEKTKDHGFTAVNVRLLGVCNGEKPDVYGRKPFVDNDPLKPNEAYFKNADTVLQMACDKNLIVALTVYQQTDFAQKNYKCITLENARPWARWVAQRYKDMPNLVWVLIPEAKTSSVPISRELAAGLREGDGGRHLITVEPDPSPYSSSFLHDENWLDFNIIQTWNAVKLIYPMVTHDYDLKPTKPVVMSEGAYEAGSEYRFEVTPLWVRRQAYYSYLAGGHHGYGHNDSWRVLPTWKQALDAPGAVQMGVLKKVFLDRKEWWRLVPDPSVFVSGGQTSDAPLPVVFATDKERSAYVRSLGPYQAGGPGANELLHLAARHEDGRWVMLYLADKAQFSVDMSKVNWPQVTIFWINPVTGQSRAVGQQANTGTKPFTTPAGWEDALLVLEAADATASPIEPTASNRGPIGDGGPAAPAKGPLRVHPKNHRYFTDGSGKAVLLTGSHTWAAFQDTRYADWPSPPAMDFDAFLNFLRRHNHNFVRFRTWESTYNPNVKQGTIYYEPMPYERTGPGAALDGKPKFDLDRFNQAYFDRLRARVAAAREKGVYVSVMFFCGSSVEGKGNVGGDPWRGHPFNSENNVNGIEGGGRKFHSLADPAVTARQEGFIRKIVDSVGDLDNVLYEIANEDTGNAADTAFQYHMIRFVKDYEATKSKQHPVGMTAQYPNGSDAVLHESPADWISPVAKVPAADGGKVILNDSDHCYFWIELKADGVAAQRAWVWKNFTRGYQCIFMDPYLDPSKDAGRNNPSGNKPDPYWDPLRDAMGLSRWYATRMNLAETAPHGELASSGFCLANPGQEYLVYLPEGGEVTVDLSAATGQVAVEWMNPVQGTTTESGPIAGGAQRVLKPPFGGDAVLHLRRN